MIKRYFNSPEDVRRLMKTTQSVFSGSFVLEFIHFTWNWVGRDLDIYATLEGSEAWDEYLLLNGYKESNKKSGAAYRCWQILDVRTYTKQTSGGPRSIDVVVSIDDASILPITSFWTTTVQNFLTADDVVIAYPTSTLYGVGTLLPDHPVTVALDPLIHKYAERDIHTVIWKPEFDTVWSRSLQRRSFLDEETMWFSLTTGTITEGRSCVGDRLYWTSVTWLDYGIQISCSD